MTGQPVTGGCQCGAVRFRAERVDNPSICHCRMCQKAFGGFYGPLVTAHGLVWTRGAPKQFQSSNMVQRGFCGDCGTPLTYDYGDVPEVAIGALDNPALAAPVVQVNLNDKQPFVDDLPSLPCRTFGIDDPEVAFMAAFESNQHPDEDTDQWRAHKTSTATKT